MAAKEHVVEYVLVDQEEVGLDGSDTSSGVEGRDEKGLEEEGRIVRPFDPSKIRVETKNTQMDALIKRIRNGEIDLAPGFQRKGGIWKEVAQSRLIESMIIRIPLPAFYMDATDDDSWLVVDGLQRLTTIRRFVIDEDLRLSDLEFLKEYEGKTFSELPRSFQRRIEETDIVLYLIQPGTPPQVKFDIFRRINTGGEPLSPQEIRHALNQGRAAVFLEELATSQLFQEATARSISASRMDDRECVLRFLAFRMTPAEKYVTDNFDAFLNDSMSSLNALDDGDLGGLKESFDRAMLAAKQIFGIDAFRKRYVLSGARHPINKALFEAWSVNLAICSDEQLSILQVQKEAVVKKFMELMTDKAFESSVSQGTGSVRRVRLRFDRIRQLISEVLSC